MFCQAARSRADCAASSSARSFSGPRCLEVAESSSGSIREVASSRSVTVEMSSFMSAYASGNRVINIKKYNKIKILSGWWRWFIRPDYDRFNVRNRVELFCP